MTGALALPGNPVNALEAVPKQYVDGLVTNAPYVKKAGDIMTGKLQLNMSSTLGLCNRSSQWIWFIF
jgi:hypothetical protein